MHVFSFTQGSLAALAGESNCTLVVLEFMEVMTVLIFYEHFLTFGDEIQHGLRCRPAPAVVFYCNRLTLLGLGFASLLRILPSEKVWFMIGMTPSLRSVTMYIFLEVRALHRHL